MIKPAKTYFDVVVVGAGFSGLYLLHQLRELGLSVKVLERGAGIGGTWYWNRYPGARCDIESMQYSFQFSEELQQEWVWTERYSAQSEILRYAEHVADRFNLRDDIQLNTDVRSTIFDEDDNTWTTDTDQGDSVTSRFLVLATGCLSKPNWPKLEGLESFRGNIYHSAEWPHHPIDFNDRRVGVIGSGSSAIQLIPVVAEQADSLTVFQRTANYSIPGHNRPLDPAVVKQIKSDYAGLRARAKETPRGVAFLKPQKLAANSTREEMIADFEWRWQYGGLAFLEGFSDLGFNPEFNKIAADFVKRKIREVVSDEKTAELLCPANIIGGKRLCVDTHYFETYNKPGVELVDVNSIDIETISKHGVIAGGRLFELDDLIIATGFDAISGALLNIDIVGKNGSTLQSQWDNGPKSYLGLTMAGFPNLFTVTGPGSPSVLTNMLCSIEQHVEWITECLSYMNENQHSTIEASTEAEEKWWAHVQEVAGSTLRSKTRSWYNGSNIENKADVFMPYVGGYHKYSEYCDDIVTKGYEGFEFS
jgi:cation diffusion facilitator CzcD-associated flavoprotein CzcO